MSDNYVKDHITWVVTFSWRFQVLFTTMLTYLKYMTTMISYSKYITHMTTMPTYSKYMTLV